ncbi:PTS sugar transporter subunit IIA [Halanaerobium salsuginis]|jgi:PTS system fructose-specific IIA component|uniref:PTS system, fructose-specific IIA component n=1 Tax=Halanaerobium salsuginis TaxID=29563 RepID=A0A1I4M7B3_9FIRM|nr:fructose PTS transporter subunit IIA [Halanaerobium salsuginis]SFL98867.1 PTS system, fructose-specific IIA component [Halanaerobium salsuginis]
MDLNKIIREERINLNLEATTKAEAIDELAEILVKTNSVSDKAGFIRDVYAREEIGETGMGGYIAIPHGKSKYVENTAIAIGRTKEILEWESLDGKGVKFILLFAVPEEAKTTVHIKLLSQVASTLGDEEVCARLLTVESADDILEIMTNH